MSVIVDVRGSRNFHDRELYAMAASGEDGIRLGSIDSSFIILLGPLFFFLDGGDSIVSPI